MITLTRDIPPQARHWRNQPEIMAWCRQNELLSEGDQERWLKHIDNNPTIRMFGIADERQYVGVCGLTSISMIHRSAEFSLYIAPEFKGHGIGKLALIELLKYGFINLGLNRIWGEVFSGNPALEMFKEVGFVEEGTLRQTYYKGGKFINSIMIGILNDDYRNKYCK